ncbi:MAG: hypothetical protein B7Y99_03255 [Caulobacterales bacterium 32-69-10]|nr:MAG: hypothetical protein B7Y99_03255 [Caulobacterales bacterium 32-69-10]
MRRLHGLRLAFFGDPAGFMDRLPEPFRTLGLLELTAATWIASRVTARPHWRSVTGTALAAAFDARGDLLAAALAPGVLRLETPPARIEVLGGEATVEPWNPWSLYRDRRRAGETRAQALKAAWPEHGPRYLPGRDAPFGPPADAAYRAWLARTAPPPADLPTGAPAQDFVAGGRLVEGASARLAEAFADPAVRMVYADEDRTDGQGEPCGPVFKTAFDAVRLERQDYIGQAFAVRPDLAAGGLDARRIAPELPAGSVRHIPLVLWRRAQAQAWPVEAPPPAQASPSVRVIVPTRDRADLLAACAAGVLERTDGAPDLCVVDNGSVEPAALTLLEALAARPRVQVLRIDGPFDFPALNNQAAADATAEVLVFLNDDTWVVEPGWLQEMTALAMRPDVGAVGAKLSYPDGRLQHAGVALGLGAHGVAGHPFRGAPGTMDGPQAMLRVVREVSAVTGACLAVQRSKFAAVGGFDPALKVAFNDVDLCLRLAMRGWKTVWTPHARLVHLESASRGSPEATAEKAVRLRQEAALMHDRWGARLAADPYYHPALSLEGERWALGEELRSTAPR